MRIVFLGTPEFSIPALENLVQSKHEVVAVYTRCPKPAGRGHKEQITPVHQFALDNKIPVFTPKTLKDSGVQKEFQDLQTDLAVVVAYGLLLPKPILDAPKYGCINIHPSGLPKFRGAAPIQHTILSGDDEAVVCIMKLDEGMDTGDILRSEKLKLSGNETSEYLHKKLFDMGADLLVKTINDLPQITPQKQSEDSTSHAYKFSKEDGKIDWNQTCKEIDRKVRALNPWPGTYFDYNGEKIKLFKCFYKQCDSSGEPGEVIDDKMKIACKDGIILPEIVQRPGKKRMSPEEMLRGI